MGRCSCPVGERGRSVEEPASRGGTAAEEDVVGRSADDGDGGDDVQLSV